MGLAPASTTAADEEHDVVARLLRSEGIESFSQSTDVSAGLSAGRVGMSGPIELGRR